MFEEQNMIVSREARTTHKQWRGAVCNICWESWNAPKVDLFELRVKRARRRLGMELTLKKCVYKLIYNHHR
jgi:hypothetical protein